MPAFVVLEHDHPTLHWDFMLEQNGVLKTWRLAVFPPAPGDKVAAQALADHRLHYLNYEGPVSGDRGRVVRRDRGMYELLENSLPGCLFLSLQGELLQGQARLRLIDDGAWTFELAEEPAT